MPVNIESSYKLSSYKSKLLTIKLEALFSAKGHWTMEEKIQMKVLLRKQFSWLLEKIQECMVILLDIFFLKQPSIIEKLNNIWEAITNKEQHSNQIPDSLYGWPKRGKDRGKQKTKTKTKTSQIPIYLSSDSHPLSILLETIVTHLNTKFKRVA